MSIELERPEHAWGRFCEMYERNRKSAESLKVDPYSVFKFHGLTAFDFGNLPEPVMKKVKRIICQGFSTTRGGNVPYYANAVCEYCPEPFSIGWICKKYMQIFLPVEEARDVYDSFRTLAGIHDDLKANDFRLQPASYGQAKIEYNGWRGNWNASMLKEVKMLVKPTYDKYRSRREVALEFLEAGGHAEKRFAWFNREK